MRRELEDAFMAACKLPRDELPRLLGDLEEIRCVAMSRLTSPPAAAQPDELVDVEECASLLAVSTDYVYHHAKEWPFTRHVGKRLVFSRNGIEKYLKTTKVA